LVEALRYKPEGRGFDSRWCHWNFSWTQTFRSHYGPGVVSASNRNKYQEYFLGVKTDGAKGRQPYYFRVSTVLKSGSLKLLEPPGPGILYLYLYTKAVIKCCLIGAMDDNTAMVINRRKCQFFTRVSYEVTRGVGYLATGA